MGGIITQLAEYLGFNSSLSDESPVAGKTKIGMESMIHQGMITVTHNTYSVMLRNRFILELPDLGRVSIADQTNWLYVSVVPDEEDDQDAEFVAGKNIEGEATFQQ